MKASPVDDILLLPCKYGGAIYLLRSTYVIEPNLNLLSRSSADAVGEWMLFNSASMQVDALSLFWCDVLGQNHFWSFSKLRHDLQVRSAVAEHQLYLSGSVTVKAHISCDKPSPRVECCYLNGRSRLLRVVL